MKRDRITSDRGFTLVELMVASVLSVLVLSVVAGMVISSITTERTVKDSTESSTLGQLAASSITRGVREASSLVLTTPSSGTQLLRVLVVDDVLATPVVAHCEAWYYGNGEVRTKRSNTAIAVPTSPSDVASWTLLAGGVTQVGSTPILTATGLKVDLSMQVAGAKGLKVLINTSVVSRQPGQPPTEVVNLCF